MVTSLVGIIHTLSVPVLVDTVVVFVGVVDILDRHREQFSEAGERGEDFQKPNDTLWPYHFRLKWPPAPEIFKLNESRDLIGQLCNPARPRAAPAR